MLWITTRHFSDCISVWRILRYFYLIKTKVKPPVGPRSSCKCMLKGEYRRPESQKHVTLLSGFLSTMTAFVFWCLKHLSQGECVFVPLCPIRLRWFLLFSRCPFVQLSSWFFSLFSCSPAYIQILAYIDTRCLDSTINAFLMVPPAITLYSLTSQRKPRGAPYGRQPDPMPSGPAFWEASF